MTLDGDQDAQTNALSQAIDCQNMFQQLSKAIRQELNTNKVMFDTAEKQTSDKFKAEIEELEMMVFDLKEFMKTKDILLADATELNANASDHDLVFRSSAYPTYVLDTIDKLCTKIPKLESFRNFLTKLPHQNIINMELDVTSIFYTPFKHLYKSGTMTVGAFKIWGMAYIQQHDQLMVRTSLEKQPLKVYRGKTLAEIRSFGSSIPEIAIKGRFHGITIDLILLPQSNGSLTVFNQKVIVKSTTDVIDKPLHGVSCSSEGDLYVVSSTQDIYLIDPTTKTVIKSFAPTIRFHEPLDVHLCKFIPGARTSPVVVFSDKTGHCVKVLNIHDRLLHMYGQEGRHGSADGQVSGISSV